MLLQDRLDAITEQTRRLVQPERLAVSERVVAELFAGGIEEHLPQTGASIPPFQLSDASGRQVRSTDVLALARPVILVFFRGRWCPYCVAELESWRDQYARVHFAGALLLAISPQTVHQHDLLVEQHRLPFPVLRDQASSLAQQLGIAYTVPEYQQRHYRSMLVNLPFLNGEPSWRLPVPATFVLSPGGAIVYARAHADFRVRPEPEEILGAVQSAA